MSHLDRHLVANISTIIDANVEFAMEKCELCGEKDDCNRYQSFLVIKDASGRLVRAIKDSYL